MLDINCLLKNTSLVKDLRDIVEYMGYERAGRNKDASFTSIFTELRKSNVEVDMRTLGRIYADVLPLHDKRFSSADHIEEVTGHKFDETVRNIMLMQPESGEQHIGQHSPEEYVANRIASTFYSDAVGNETTKSVMKEMQDAMFRGAQRLLGELPSKGESAARDKEHFTETIDRALALEQKGYNTLSGKMNGIHDLFHATQKELGRYTDAINGEADHMTAEQWNGYVGSMEDAAYSVLLGKKEARTIVNEALKEGGFGKELSNGETILDWQKLSGGINDVTQLRDNVRDVLEKRGYDAYDASRIANSLQKEYHELRASILEHATNKLNTLDKNLDKEKGAQKNDLKRLSELNDLGIFNRTHDAVLNNILGISDASNADMQALQSIAQKAADLSRELGGKDYLGTYAFQTFQREINNIVAKNITSKSRLLKITTAISKYFQLQNMGIIGNAYNMTENNLSGAKELFASSLNMMQQMGVENMFKDGKLIRDTWKNIAAGGSEYGFEPTRISSHEHINDQLNVIDFKNHPVKSLGTVIIAPAKAFLNGSDGAYKAGLHRKSMMLALHKALTTQGMGKEEAAHFLHEALYGKGLADANKRASDLLDKYGIKNTPAARTRLANDLIIGNLNMDGKLTDDVIEAARKSAFHIASIGLGHEANNPFSRNLQNGRMAANRREEELAKQDKLTALAGQRMLNTIWFNGVLRFMGGAANWARLRIESGFGVGIATGLMGNWKGELDFTSKDKLEDSMKSYLKAQREITRGMVGLGFTTLFGAALYGYGKSKQNQDDKKDKSVMEEAYAGMKKSYVLNRFMNKVGPDVLLLNYFKQTSKSDSYLEAGVKYVQNTFNLGSSFSIGGQLTQAAIDARTGNEKGMKKAEGDVGGIGGSYLDFPFWKSYKGAVQLAQWTATGKEPDPAYKKPFTFMEGLIGGGILEDLGVWDRNAVVSSLPGVSQSDADWLSKQGVTHINDLKNDPSKKKFLPEKARDTYEQLYEGAPKK